MESNNETNQTPQQPVSESPSPATEEKKAKKPRAPRKKKADVPTEPKQARKPRTPRKKKTTDKTEPVTPQPQETAPAAEETVEQQPVQQPAEEVAEKVEVTEVTEATEKAEVVKEQEETPAEDTQEEEYVEPAVHTYDPISLSKPEPTLPPAIEEPVAQEEVPSTDAHAKKQSKPEPKPIPPCPTLLIRDIVDLINAPQRQLLLNDQQIQQLPLEEAQKRFRWIEGTLALVLNYDVVISDTNIWIELLTGHTSSHSDPRFNCRLQFERQLEFISKLTRHRSGRFMMMSETYEEIDRFATQMDPVSHREADFSDEAVCRNIAGRLAKRLILSLQRENRLRIEGIGSESHHSSFADPAIIRRCVELFATGRKVLLLTNDASVAIRAMGMCDDLQRTNGIDDEVWDEVYAPIRPMVMTFDDLKVLDAYTRQYHFLQMAAGKQWMEDVPTRMEKRSVNELTLWLEGFRPGDRHSEKKMQQQKQQGSQNNNNQPKQKQQPKQQNQPKPKQEQQKQEQPKPQPVVEQSKSKPVVEQPKSKPEQPKPQQEQHKPEQPKPQPVAEPKPVVEQPAPASAPQTQGEPKPSEQPQTDEQPKEQKPRRRGGRRSGKKPSEQRSAE